MIITKENTFNWQPLMFYTTAGYTSDNQIEYGNQLEKPLIIVDSTNLIPFQLLKTDSGSLTDDLTVAKLINQDSGEETNILSLITAEVVTNASATKGYITYDGTSTVNASYGTYKMYCTDDTTEWTSEIFKICDTTKDDYVKIEYYSDYDNFDFIYQTGFKFWLFLETGINTEPDIIAQEILTNEDNENKVVEDIRNPRYSFNVLAKDWLYRTLSLVAQHDNITLTESINLVTQSFSIENLEVTPSRTDVNYYNCLVKFGIVDDTSVFRKNQQTNVTLTTNPLTTEGGSILQTEDGQDLIR